MSFDHYTKMAGFAQYYGRNEYQDKYPNSKEDDSEWGIFDEPFFQYFAHQLQETPQPFFSSIFTLSSHHPYTIPQQYQGRFPKGHLAIHESVGYADYALKKFFQTASQMSWFENTLFVITADHTSEAYFPYYKNAVGQFRVPIAFYEPASNRKIREQKLMQQTDIMPTVLDLLGVQADYVAFGSSVLDSSQERFAMYYRQGIHHLIKDGYLLQLAGDQPKALFDLATDSLLVHNQLAEKASVVNVLDIFAKAVIQQYNNRLINNVLTVRREE